MMAPISALAASHASWAAISGSGRVALINET
jgi:hypothetical protein